MPIQKWKKLSEKVLFVHPRITLMEDTFKLPDGKVVQYLRFKKAGNAVTIIAKREDGKILLEREYSAPPDEILYQFPGGGVPLGEDVQNGANRELMEECHLRGEIAAIGSYYIDNRRTDAKMFVTLATNLEQAELPSDPEEFIENEWHTEEQIDSMIAHGEIQHSHALATWSVYQHYSRKGA